MKRLPLALAFLLAPFAAHAAGETAGKANGSPKRERATWFSSLAAAKKLCGKIVWLKDPLDESGPLVDALNQDEGLRGPPIAGMRLTELEPDGNGGWKGVI